MHPSLPIPLLVFAREGMQKQWGCEHYYKSMP